MRTLIIAACLVIAAFAAGRISGHYAPHPCSFDGGGTLVSGDAARTTDGHIWACADGQLYKIK